MGAIPLALALGLGLAACATPDQTGSMSHRVQAWVSGTGFEAAAKALSADVARIQSHRRTATPGVVKFNCVTLGQNITKDNSELPTPDHTFTLDLAHAYNAYYSYATICVAHNAEPATLEGIDHYLTTGTRALASAQARRASLAR